MDELNRKGILNEILRIIRNISDRNYQLRAWIRGIGPECDDFTETYCCFFEPIDSVLEEYDKYGMTIEQKEILQEFRDKFKAFGDNNDEPIFFINSPEWIQLGLEALKVLKVFNYSPEYVCRL